MASSKQFSVAQVEKRVRQQSALADSDKTAMLQQIGTLQQGLAAANSLLNILNTNDTAMNGSLNTIANALGLLTGRVTAEEGLTTTFAQQIAALDANKLNRVALPDWTVVIANGLTVALAAGNRTYTLSLAASLGIKAGDPIFVSPKAAVPAGYLVGAASAPANNQLQVQIGNPLIAIGGSMSIVLSVFTLRP